MAKSNLEKEGLQLIRIKAKESQGKSLRQKPEAETMEEHRFLPCSSGPNQLPLFVQAHTSHSGQSSPNKQENAPQISTVPSDRSSSSTRIPSSHMWLGLCQVEKN